jgi:hypothetical protein
MGKRGNLVFQLVVVIRIQDLVRVSIPTFKCEIELQHSAPALGVEVGAPGQEMGKTSGVFGTSDNYDSVKLKPMRESDPALGLGGP